MSKKTRRVLLIIYAVAFLSCFVGASLAFFTNMQVERVSPETDIGSATLASVLFDVGAPLNIYADEFNFAYGMDNLYDETYATATIKPGTVEETTRVKYNISLVINENTLEYSNVEKTAELLIQIKDVNGNIVTEIDNLEYTTVNGESGFDITEKKGEFMIAQNHELVSAVEVTERWDVKLIFVNKDNNQDINKGKLLSGYLKIEPIKETE